MNLSEQTLLVTGGAAGIGRHIVETLGPECRAIVVLDRDEQGLKQLRERMPSAQCHVCDVTEPSRVSDAIQGIYRSDAVSVLVNNAGLIHSEPLVNLLSREDKKHSLENWKRTIDINLNSAFYVASCVAEQMVERRIKGLLVNVSSISAAGNVGQSAYSAAKAAVNALTVTWAKELGMFGIRTAAIAPGFFDTPSTRRSLSDANIQKWIKATPLGRMGTLDEIAHGLRFIIENDFYHGRILELDGGLRI